MNSNRQTRVWELFVELRRELVESQKVRAQITGFKISFVSAAMGLMAANIGNLDNLLFVIPAFAAICFDYLIYSYSFSIKRIGLYCREHLEPALRASGETPEGFTHWQEYLADPRSRQRLSFVGNFGFSLITAAIGLVALFFPFRPLLSTMIGLALLAFLGLDVAAFRSPSRLGRIWRVP